MATARINLRIDKGATFTKYLTWKADNAPVDLTGCAARMHIRTKADAAGDPLAALTTENSGVILGGTAGTVELRMSAADTSALSFKKGVYDLEVVFTDGTVKRLMEGEVEVTPEVTR